MNDYVVLDIEATKLPNIKPWQDDSYLCSIGIEFPDKTSRVWFFNPSVGDSNDHIKEIQDILYDTKTIVGHNIKFDLLWLISIQLDLLHNDVWCTMVGNYLLNGQRTNGNSLNAVAAVHGHGQKEDAMKAYWDAGYETDAIPLDIHETYLKQDLNLTHQIYLDQVRLMKAAELLAVADVTFKMTKLLAYTECNGAPFDMNKAQKYLSDAKSEVESLSTAIQEIAGVRFNLASTLQLSSVLFGGVLKVDGIEEYDVTLKSGEVKHKTRKIKLDVECPGMGFICPNNCMSKTTGRPSVSTQTINTLKANTPTQKLVLDTLRNQKKIAKIVSTLEGATDSTGWMSKVTSDGRLHGDFNQAITITGRLSSSNPNLQNIPRKGTSPIKQVFSPTGDNVILNADLAQIEWRVAAELSRDPVMLEELYNDVDIHSANAISIFGANPDDKDSEDADRRLVFSDLRQASKTVSFRLLYGGSARGFFYDSRMPDYSLKKWSAIVDAFYEKYQGLREWHIRSRSSAQKDGFLRTPSGRALTFKNINWCVDKEVTEWEREVCNYPVQSFSADILNIAAIEMAKRMSNLKSKIILFVHDSIVFECVPEEVEFICTEVLTIFKSLPKLIKDYFEYDVAVPLFGDCELGKNYGALKKVTPDTVCSVLKTLTQ